ncbi:unnamed protein product [Prunus brigantina]
MVSKGSLSCTTGLPLFDPSIYRQLVGTLQYLTLTYPDIAYAVQSVSQFMGSPTDLHNKAVKRIRRYLKGTLGHGLPLRRSTDSSELNFSLSQPVLLNCDNLSVT